MDRLITLIGFAFESIKIKFWEMLCSFAVVIIFGALYNLYLENKQIYNEHSENKRTTQNSIETLDEETLKEYENLLRWFHSGKNEIPNGAEFFVEDVKREARTFINSLNLEIVTLNELQQKALDDKVNELGRPLNSSEYFPVLIKAYVEGSREDINRSCNNIFIDGSTVRPQGLTSGVRSASLKNRTKEGGNNSLASLDFSIISSSQVPGEESSNKDELIKFWTFRPTCHLFNEFDNILRTNLTNKKRAKTINDTLTAIFAPNSFSLDAKGNLSFSKKIYERDPNLRIRALYVGLDDGSRISFPGTKFNKTNQILYNPADRPWFKLVHNDPDYKTGDCSISKPYADIGTQLVIVRTIVCKGEFLSYIKKKFAFGIDIVINKSELSINSDLEKIKSRLRDTASPYKALNFKYVDKEDLPRGDLDSKGADKSNNGSDYEGSEDTLLGLLKNSNFANVTVSIFNDVVGEGGRNITNDGSIIILLIVIVVSLSRVRSKKFIYVRLVKATLFGEKEIETISKNSSLTSGISKILSYKLGDFFAAEESIHRTTVNHPEVKIQRDVRAKQKVHVLIGRSINFSVLGLVLEIPLSTCYLNVLLSQNRADSISILNAHDFKGRSVSSSEEIEPNKDLMLALTRISSGRVNSSLYVQNSLRKELERKLTIPEMISTFTSVKKFEERSLLFARKRIRIKTNHAELMGIFNKRSMSVVNRLSDIKSVLRRTPDTYLKLIASSNGDVKRYILCCDEDELKEFNTSCKHHVDEMISKAKKTKSWVKFILVPSLLGANLFNTEHEQFILLENFVIVIEGFERVIAKGGVEKDDTFLTGYISWNEADLSFYRLFLREVEDFCAKNKI